MPRVSGIEILQRNEQTTISVRVRTPVEKLPMLIGASYGKMAAYLYVLGEHLADIPYVAYFNMDMQDLDVEIGFPVSKALPGKEGIKPGFIPAGKMAFCMYRGAYRELEPVYAEMAEWIAEKGCAPAGPAYEFYYNGPEFPESELLTKIMMPIA